MANQNHPYVGGVLNMGGAIPGQAYNFPDPIFPHMTCYLLKFDSTYEAIEKYVLPPPLKADRSHPPEVYCWYFSNPGARGPGGHLNPYHGFQFRANTEFNGIKGGAGWEYVDGWNGDKTNADVMGSWGIQFGMMKKFANIHFAPIGGDRFEITADRQGQQLAKITISMGEEKKGSASRGTEDPDNMYARPTFTVREIPNSNYTGYSERSVNITYTTKTNKVLREWTAHSASIEFGHQEMDPLSELRPHNVVAVGIQEMETYKATFTEMQTIATL